MSKRLILLGLCLGLILAVSACQKEAESPTLEPSSVSSAESSLENPNESLSPDSSAEESSVSVLASTVSEETASPSSAAPSRESVSSEASVISQPESTAEPSQTESSTAPAVSSEAGKQITVSMTIVGVDGEPMVDAGSFSVAEDSTVFTVLRDYAKAAGLPMSYRGGNKSAYVWKIGDLCEFDHGGTSGWLYRVNGEFDTVSVGCGRRPVKDGDRIEWLYTVNLGEDVRARS